MGDADQGHRRAVGQCDRGVAVTLLRGGDDLLDSRRILAGERDRVAAGVAEAVDRVVPTRPALAEEIGAAAAVQVARPAAAVNPVAAAPAADRLGTGAAINRVIAGIAIEHAGPGAAMDQVVAPSATDGFRTTAAKDRVSAGTAIKLARPAA